MTRNYTRLKPQGAWEVKRRITLPAMTHQLDTRTITDCLRGIPGVRGASADLKHHRVAVVYNVTQSTYRELLRALEEIGFPTAGTRWERFKANHFQYLDTNGRENANAPAAPCCSNPKGISQPRR